MSGKQASKLSTLSTQLSKQRKQLPFSQISLVRHFPSAQAAHQKAVLFVHLGCFYGL
jgi:hypothetical protein